MIDQRFLARGQGYPFEQRTPLVSQTVGLLRGADAAPDATEGTELPDSTNQQLARLDVQLDQLFGGKWPFLEAVVTLFPLEQVEDDRLDLGQDSLDELFGLEGSPPRRATRPGVCRY